MAPGPARHPGLHRETDAVQEVLAESRQLRKVDEDSAQVGRPAALVLAHRGPGPARLMHGKRRRRPLRVLRASRARQARRRLATVPLQGDPQAHGSHW